MYVIKIAFIAFIAFAVTPKAQAIDNIKMHSPTVGEDKRTMHKNEVLIRALEISKQIYGSYTIDFLNVELSTARALRVIKKGEMINVFIAAANDNWDKFATPIKIPIRFGQLSYRLLLVNKSNLDAFKAIESLSDLKQLTAGLQRGWALNDIFNEVNIEVLTSSDFEGLFQMLNSGRFDYFPRAVYEAYNELENRSDVLNNIVVEPTLALYIPSKSYVYVSNNAPRIAQRLEYGLKIMKKNGELKAIYNQYYKEDIIRANLSNRKIITIETPYFSNQKESIDVNISSN